MDEKKLIHYFLTRFKMDYFKYKMTKISGWKYFVMFRVGIMNLR